MLCACVVVISLKEISLSKNISLKVFNGCLFFKAFF